MKLEEELRKAHAVLVDNYVEAIADGGRLGVGHIRLYFNSAEHAELFQNSYKLAYGVDLSINIDKNQIRFIQLDL